jgi:hypothetical protein
MDKNLKKLVNEVLIEFPKSRDSDWFLIEKVLESLGINLIINTNGNDLPSAESITRERRLIMLKNKHLRPNKVIQEFRDKKEDNFEGKNKYSSSGIEKNSNLIW